MSTTQVQQRFPNEVLEAVDSFAASHAMTRTAAITHMCQFFLEAIEIEKLRRENKELREKVVRLAMERRPAPTGSFQTLAQRCFICSLKSDPRHCETCPWPGIHESYDSQ
jgi:hypothetical protein